MSQVRPSSDDLHPSTGARFVFDREPSATLDQPPSYVVTIFLPGSARWSGRLSWTEGRAAIVPAADQAPPDQEPWVAPIAEALKLARVLHRDPKQHMVRWRGL